MMHTTEKKTKALLERGMEKVGYVLKGKDGGLAYVEGGAVRWLDADKRAAFMFPHGKDSAEVGPPLRYEGEPQSRAASAFNRTGVALMALLFYVGFFWGVPFAAFANTTPESIGCSLTEFILLLHAVIILIAWSSTGAVNITKPLGIRFRHQKLPETLSEKEKS
jgi:hypothetical protein